MGGIAVPLAKHVIEPVLGRRQRSLDPEAQAAEPRRPDRHKQRVLRFDTAFEIGDSSSHQIRAG